MLSTKVGKEKLVISSQKEIFENDESVILSFREIFDGSLTLSPHGNLVVMLWFALKANFENSLPDLGQL